MKYIIYVSLGDVLLNYNKCYFAQLMIEEKVHLSFKLLILKVSVQ